MKTAYIPIHVYVALERERRAKELSAVALINELIEEALTARGVRIHENDDVDGDVALILTDMRSVVSVTVK